MGYLRKAEWQDIQMLLKWNNEKYNQWFKDILSRNDMEQYVYLENDMPAGLVGIAVNGQVSEVSYNICKDKRCMGYEKDILGLLQEQIKRDYPQARKLSVKVMPLNIASQKTLMDMGYEEKCGVFELEMNKAEPYHGKLDFVRGSILYLTNNCNALDLYDWLRERCPVVMYSGRLELCQVQELQPELVVSYNYRYLIKEPIIQFMKGNIINLHISFLPWNRGVSPNIWSFIDDTPKGVTIHQVSSDFDTGKILYQKQCYFNPEKETFATVYEKLHQMIKMLFIEKWDEIRSHTYSLFDQHGTGSSHSKKDLLELKAQTEFCWDENIAQFLHRYKRTFRGHLHENKDICDDA